MPSGGKFSSRGRSRSRSVAGGKTRKRYGKKRSKTRRRKIIKGGIVLLS
jgi:hypothetical protein